ncbi:uncharacterized protein DNG_00399 [Cephalotrichum gorgonifer]|uniref:Ubiquitin-like-conjugating enzyme ATG10 n=1 Tax=Cephalotrichum gorgonifer TaxID=2041049 RepID=A0AAE8MNR1_9PEZI|nr:uncharacterized protein DNG_00399 [Cephalotrichum gorgonifer]
MDFKQYPFLDKDEFAEVCHFIDRHYRQATLGPLRRRWKLRVHTSLAAAFGDADSSTYIQIIRPLEANLDPGDLSLEIEKISFNEATVGHEDQDMMEGEEADEAVLKRDAPLDIGHVVYEIHLHPTYRMPCLWFSLHGLPPGEPAFNIDTVFRHLVPDQFKDALRGTGGIGGISGDHHPITGVPSFFIHPCLLGDAMSGFDCSKDNYLMVWLGLVGGCVGLWVPKEMAMDHADNGSRSASRG